MGSSGEHFVCERGHLFNTIEEHLCWDDEMFAMSERIKEEGCPCGAKTENVLSHYGGDINECNSDTNPQYVHDSDDIMLVPIGGICDKEGKPIENTYHWITLPKYKKVVKA